MHSKEKERWQTSGHAHTPEQALSVCFAYVFMAVVSQKLLIKNFFNYL